MKHLLGRLPAAVKPEYKVSLIATVFKAILYNPALICATLEEAGAIGAIPCCTECVWRLCACVCVCVCDCVYVA